MTTLPKLPKADCANCPLKNRPFVPPYIPQGGANVIVVGEAPGNREAIEKKPFVGPSGQLLDAALKHAGQDPAQVAKTNAVCCLPLDAGQLFPTAIKCCAGALQETVGRTLEHSPDRLVISAGSVPLSALQAVYGHVTDQGVMAVRGQQFYNDDYDLDLRPILHPAYVLRNEGALKTFLKDVKQIFNPSPPVDFDVNKVTYDVVSDFGELRKALGRVQSQQLIAFDVETEYLQWYDTPTKKAGDLLCLVLATSNKHAIIVEPAIVKARPDLWNAFFDQVALTAHNGKYDQEVINRYDLHPKLAFDTLLLHYALDENKGTHGLKELAKEYLNVPDYEYQYIDSWFKAHKVKKADRNYGMLPKENLYKYAAIDGCATFELTRLLIAETEEAKVFVRPFRSILMHLSETLLDIELTGIKIDREWLKQVNLMLVARLAAMATDMRIMVDRPKLNLNSPQQVSDVIYNQLKLKLTKKLLKPTGTNTGKEALDALPVHPFVDLLREYRRVEKMRNTYVEKLLELADVNDRIHVNYNIHGTEIGRLSANDSLHGIPRPDDIYGQAIRSAFVADKGNVLVIADYSQAELRVFAANSQDPKLLEAYRNGEDVHNKTAVMLDEAGAAFFKDYKAAKAGAEYDENGQPLNQSAKDVKRLRVVAKNTNFGGLCYQGGATGISGMLAGKIPIPVLEQILKHFHTVYPRAFEYAREQFSFLKSHGYVRTRFNRYRRFQMITRQNEDEARKAAVHMVTASEAADLTHLSMIVFQARAKETLVAAKIVHTMHDSILVECPKDAAQLVASMLKNIMEDIGNTFVSEVPWVADVEISDRWVPKPELKETGGDTNGTIVS